jgi:predicted RNase H-like HicB family nuclease
MHKSDPQEESDMKSYIFRVIVREDVMPDGTSAFHAYCPALKGCHTWGHTEEEALANVREAIELYVEDLREAGQLIPIDPAQGTLEWPTPAVVVNV